MFKNKSFKKIFSTLFTILTISYTGSFGCDTVLALKYDSDTGTVTLDKPLHQIIITSKEHYDNGIYTEKLKEDFKFTGYWRFEYVNGMTRNNVIQHVVPIDQLLDETLKTLHEYDGQDDVIYSIELDPSMDYKELPKNLISTVLLRGTDSQLTDMNEDNLQALFDALQLHQIKTQKVMLCQISANEEKNTTYYTSEGKPLKPDTKVIPQLPPCNTINNTRDILEEELLKKQKGAYQKNGKSQNRPADPTIPNTNPSDPISSFKSSHKGNNFGHPDAGEHLVDEDDESYIQKIEPAGLTDPAENIDVPTILNSENTTIFSKIKKFTKQHPKTSVGLGAAIVALGGTVIYTLKQLFTRQTKKSQAKNQITQKYNQHVKNKI